VFVQQSKIYVSIGGEMLDYRQMDEVFGVFRVGRLLDFLNFLKVADRNGYSIDELKEYLSMKTTSVVEISNSSAADEMKKVMSRFPKCPNCGESLSLRPIMIPKNNRTNKYGWKSVWECRNKKCYYEEFNTRSVVEIIDEIKARSRREK